MNDSTNLDKDHEQHLAYLRGLDQAALKAGLLPIIVVTTQQDTPAPNANWRYQYGRFDTELQSPRGLLVLVTQSAIQRGVLTAISWVASKRKLEFEVAKTFEDACRVVASFRGQPVPELVTMLESTQRGDRPQSRTG